VHLGPQQVLAAISVDFVDDISARDVEAIVASVEERVRKAHPEVVSVLVTPQSAKSFHWATSEEEP
jgi:divalent metal cation (Fe/Co/Zn/Cd) transporter